MIVNVGSLNSNRVDGLHQINIGEILAIFENALIVNRQELYHAGPANCCPAILSSPVASAPYALDQRYLSVYPADEWVEYF